MPAAVDVALVPTLRRRCRWIFRYSVHRYLMLPDPLRYAELGYRVFPCAGKTPLTPHGCKDATSDSTQIEAWLSKWPKSNWAIATDGLLVVDVDMAADGENP